MNTGNQCWFSMEDAVELPLWLNNLIAYSLQIAILAAAGTLFAYLFQLRLPRVTLIYWQVLLFICLIVPFLQSWEHPVLKRVILRSASPAMAGMPITTGAEAPPAIPWEMLALILAAGIFLRLTWLMIGFFRLHLFHRNSCMFIEEHAAVRDMQWRTGVRVSLLLSDEIDSPVTFGLHTPKIILPLSFKNLSEPCQKAVLCHELLHVRRYDWIRIIVEEIICSIFWFHPAIWWLRSRIHLSREQAVDHEVVQLTGSRQPYLDSLLEFAQAQGRPRAVPAPLFLKERQLVQRVALLLKEVSMSRSRLAISMIGVCILLVCTLRLAAAWFPLAGEPVTIPEQKAISEVKPSLPQAPLPVPQRSTRLEAAVQPAIASEPAPVQTVRVEADAALSAFPVPVPEQSAEKVSPPKGEPIRVGGNVQETKLIHKVAPIYPEQAKRKGIQGTVNLTVTIDEEGLVNEIKSNPENNPILEEAAVNAVKEWKYSPTFLNGKPVSVVATVSVTFRLSDTPSASQSPNAPSEGTVWKSDPIVVGSNVPESKLIRRVEPIYPALALKARVQGKVVLRITVNEQGFVTDAQVVSGHPLLNEAAIDAVRQWQYSPTLLNGAPVPVIATVTLIFNLK
jgi:TonB family protein